MTNLSKWQVKCAMRQWVNTWMNSWDLCHHPTHRARFILRALRHKTAGRGPVAPDLTSLPSLNISKCSMFFKLFKKLSINFSTWKAEFFKAWTYLCSPNLSHCFSQRRYFCQKVVSPCSAHVKLSFTSPFIPAIPKAWNTFLTSPF